MRDAREQFGEETLATRAYVPRKTASAKAFGLLDCANVRISGLGGVQVSFVSISLLFYRLLLPIMLNG
jgi:hypothetical protein